MIVQFPIFSEDSSQPYEKNRRQIVGHVTVRLNSIESSCGEGDHDLFRSRKWRSINGVYMGFYNGVWDIYIWKIPTLKGGLGYLYYLYIFIMPTSGVYHSFIIGGGCKKGGRDYSYSLGFHEELFPRARGFCGSTVG